MQGRRVQTHLLRSVKARLATKAAGPGAGRQALRTSKENGLSSSALSVKIPVKTRPERVKIVRRRSRARYGEPEGNPSTKAECPKPEIALISATKVQNLSNSDSSGRNGAREIYVLENVSTAVIGQTTSTV